jgi:hypothetical protein
MLSHGTTMLFTVQDMQNFFTMDEGPQVLAWTKRISCWINTMELQENRVARKNQLSLLSIVASHCCHQKARARLRKP